MRTLSRKSFAWCCLCGITLPGIFVYVHFKHRVYLSDVERTVPADGREHRIALVRQRWPFTLSAAEGGRSSGIRAENLDAFRIALYLRSPVLPGNVHAVYVASGRPVSLEVDAIPSEQDSAGDGTPDYLRLHSAADRTAFRTWFTNLALQAADTAPDRLPGEITDCASLLRWAYRQTLLRHDDRWYRQFTPGEMPSLPSVEQWAYPETPLGANLFRVTSGHYRLVDAHTEAFAQFADAKTLFSRNAFLVGRDLQLAKPGDLIFFHQLEQNSTYHSMIITEKQGAWVIYHTGPIDGHRGEMRRVLIDDLLHHPDPRWHPIAGNPNFLGVYRWNILRED